MKKQIAILVFMMCVAAGAAGQGISSRQVRFDASFIIDPFYNGRGALLKSKMEAFSSSHFEGSVGLGAQILQNNEQKFSRDIDGYTRDLGLYAVGEWSYFPLRSKSLFIAIEPFAGITCMRSKGRLSLPDYDVYEVYSKTYRYFNYGATLSIGYDFGKFNTSVFSMASLKGLLDQGRTRVGDSDSRVLLGLNVGYKLKLD